MTCRRWAAILWSRIPNIPFRVSSWCTYWYLKVLVIPYVLIQAETEVPIPSDYGLPYEDLPLKTPDGVTLRCYLLPLKKSLASSHSDFIKPEMIADHETDEEVRITSLFQRVTAVLNYLEYVVLRKQTDGDYVSRQCGESWASYTSRQGVSTQYAL